MQHLTATALLTALAGGALIGIAASVLWLHGGRVAGVSGILASALPPTRFGWNWRTAFLSGLLVGGLVLSLLAPARFNQSPRSLIVLALAGLLVGFGTQLGGGCTSGHGVCGVSRLSPRSLMATAIFVAAGIATVTALRLSGAVLR